MKNVVVVGGGIIGLCTAYFLKKEGCEVTVIDKSGINSGASFVNAGYISPSHIISLASPGMLKKGLRYMFHKEAPFYIKPRFDLSFMAWAYQFYKSATAEKVRSAIPVIKEISLLGLELYDQIRRSEDLGQFHWEKKGLLLLYKTEREAAAEEQTAKLAIREGLEVVRLSRKELLKLEPYVDKSVQGAFWYKCDAHSTPNEFMENMLACLKKNDVKFITNEEVTDIIVQNDTILKIKTAKALYELDEMVLAAGSWTGTLAKKLNLKLPVQPGKGYSINSSRDLKINYPAVLMESKVAVTPMKGFTRFAGTMEFSGSNHLLRPERVEAIARAASSYYSGFELNAEELQLAKCGLRPVTPDGLPFIGRPERLKNLIIAAGHAMMGWSMGPATGKLVSELILHKKTSMNIDAFNPDRFK